jgi:hypothetical protein
MKWFSVVYCEIIIRVTYTTFNFPLCCVLPKDDLREISQKYEICWIFLAMCTVKPSASIEAQLLAICTGKPSASIEAQLLAICTGKPSASIEAQLCHANGIAVHCMLFTSVNFISFI